MTDTPSLQPLASPPPAPPTASQSLVTAALVVYALFALAAVVGLASAGLHTTPLLSVVGVIGLIVAYVKRGDAAGTWVASHLTYLIRTFWWALGASLIGWLFAVTIIFFIIPIASAIWVATDIWIIYRVIRGYLHFKDSAPIPVN